MRPGNPPERIDPNMVEIHDWNIADQIHDFFLDCPCGQRIHWRARPARAVLLAEGDKPARPTIAKVQCDCGVNYPFAGEIVGRVSTT